MVGRTAPAGRALQKSTAAREAPMEIDDSRPSQQDLAPAAKGRVDLAARVEPAALVGGDFFDHAGLGDRHLFLLVADVSGRGAEASKFMVLCQRLWKSAVLRTGPDLAAIQARANADILRDNAAMMFVTGLAALLDLETGELAYASAGHHAPFLFGNGRAPAQLGVDTGPPLGLVRDAAWPVCRCRLAPGDRLCLFSDGISEAMDPSGARFGRDRLRQALAETPPDADSATVVACVLARTAAFTADAEQADDLTLMVLSVARDTPPSATDRRI
jgi:serine phosphatase RsbU (regulator of sigma subunit)